MLPHLAILFTCYQLFVAGRAVHPGEHELMKQQDHDFSQYLDPPSRELAKQKLLFQDNNAMIDGPQLGFPRTGEHIVVGGHNATIGQYLWSGRTGEYYEVPGGWPGWKGDVVAKEFYIWYWPHELARELKYLSRVGQFIAHDDYKGFQWLIMRKPPGVHLTKTQAFKEAYRKGRRECDNLVENAYGPAFSAIIDMVHKYGIYHEVLNTRMLWDDTASNVTVFDLGDDRECDPEDADDQDVRNETALKVYMAWPNDGVSYQDWCVNGQSQ